MSETTESPVAAHHHNALTETAGARQDQSRELADLQVMHYMARQYPRDREASLERMLKAFSKIDLAVRAQYQYARGGTDIRGPSIQALQAIALEWENIDAMWRERSRGIDGRGIPYSEVETVAVDLQSRTRKRIAFICPHWRDTKTGGYLLRDERDIYELCANQAQRRVRACLEAVIPADVVAKVMELVDAVLLKHADTRPEAMANMIEAFAPFGITKTMIERRIQRSLDAITPKLVVDLKRIYASLRDDMSTASDWFEGIEPADAAAAKGSGTAAVKSRMKAGAKKTANVSRGTKEEDAPPAAAEEKTSVTFAYVADALNAAKDIDALNIAADLIRHVPAKFQAELLQINATRAAELSKGGA